MVLCLPYIVGDVPITLVIYKCGDFYRWMRQGHLPRAPRCPLCGVQRLAWFKIFHTFTYRYLRDNNFARVNMALDLGIIYKRQPQIWRPLYHQVCVISTHMFSEVKNLKIDLRVVMQIKYYKDSAIYVC